MSDQELSYREVTGRDVAALLNPRPVVLITTGGTFAPDIAPVAWVTPLSHEPSLVGVALRPVSANYKSLSVSGEFVLNVVGPQLADAIDICGAQHGHGRQKLEQSGIELDPGEAVNAPHVRGAISWLECMVEDLLEVGGDHSLVVAQVVAAHTSCSVDEKGRVISPDTLLCLQHGAYGTLDAEGCHH